jgi:hypothetical protein
MRESEYQAHLIKTLKEILPDCVVLKNDSGYLQGVPDLLVLWNDHWAMLEVKAARDSHEQPNQRFWVEQFGVMSFAAFIYPENEEVILRALQRSFGIKGSALIPKR